MKYNWKKNVSDTMHWVGLAMVLIYLGLGLFFIFYKDFDYVDKNIKYIMAFFFVSYGFFRGVRWLQKHKSRKFDFEEDEIEDNKIF